MTVKDAIEKTGFRFGHIEYRTNAVIDGEEQNIFAGLCSYDGEKLISLDGDSYSLDDQINWAKFDKGDMDNNRPDVLTVWYESRWVSG